MQRHAFSVADHMDVGKPHHHNRNLNVFRGLVRPLFPYQDQARVTDYLEKPLGRNRYLTNSNHSANL